MNEKLMACPFCGASGEDISEGEALLATDDGKFHKQTGCTQCGALGPVAVNHDLYDNSTANAAWNRISNK